jgi:formylglycine-generating enzyme required for sulfatase activity
VIDVHWNDAKSYAGWLSAMTGTTYPLLSESEREYAARAGTTTPFWWGSSITAAQANYFSEEVYKGGGKKGVWRKELLPVETFAANPWGLYQLHGNVHEWKEDCWNSRNIGNPGAGEARTSGDCSHRVARGGSHVSRPVQLRSAYRSRFAIGSRFGFLGFRLARTLPP